MHHILRIVTVAVLAALYAPALALAAVDDPVESGRDALGGQPWYDADADDVRPVQTRQVKEKKANPDRPESSAKPVSSGLFAGAEIIAWIAVGTIVVGLVALLIYAILQRDTPARSKTKIETSEVDLDALPVPLATADTDLLAEARRLYERGEFAKAMIYLYSHMLLRLDRGHFIRLAKGKTNRQYLREVRARRPMAEFFESAMHTFEAVFFGKRDLARDEFEASWRGIDNFHRMIDEAHA
jgi:hypothetical protein